MAAPLVVVNTVNEEPIVEIIPLTGSASTLKIANLSSEVSGLVKKVYVDTGVGMAAGETIARLDQGLMQFDLDTARAKVLAAAEELANAQRKLKDAQQLAAQKTISQNALELLKAEEKIAKAHWKQYQAELAAKQARLERHTIKAPFSGTISQLNIAPGEWVSPGDTVATLVNTSQISVDFQIPQRLYPHIRSTPPDQTEIIFDALPGQRFAVKTLVPIPYSDQATRTMLVKAQLEKPHPNIVPGMSAKMQLPIVKQVSGVTVLRDAIIRYADGRTMVWVVIKKASQTIAVERPVKIGLGFDNKFEVLSGLKPGEQVIIAGGEALKNNQIIRVEYSK